MANGRLWTAIEDDLLRATLHLHLKEVMLVLKDNGYERPLSGVAHRRSRVGETGGFKRLAAGVKAERERVYHAGKNKPCKVCGVKHIPSGMEYDHLPGVVKGPVELSNCINNGYTVEAVLAEIAKCQVLCAGCHRAVTRAREIRGNGPKKAPARPLTVTEFSFLWEYSHSSFYLGSEVPPVIVLEFDIMTGYYQRGLATLLHYNDIDSAYQEYVTGDTWDASAGTASTID